MLLLGGWGPGFFILLGGFASVRLLGRVQLREYLPFPIIVLNNVIVIVLFSVTLSSVLLCSKSFYISVRRKALGMLIGHTRYSRRMIKSVQPFGISNIMGKPVKRESAGNTFIFLVDSLITLLVSFPSEYFSL
jgi:hypothetical protein